jgi:RNA polymerase sigma-70 factor (ECF subfamily)
MQERWDTRKSLLMRASDPDDHKAFEEFTYYYKNFIQMILRKLGVKAYQLNDLQQDLLVKLWKDLGKFDLERQKSNFRGWLSVVIRHEVYRFFKKNKREAEFQDSLLADSTAESDVDKIIESEWQAYVVTLAVEKMKAHFDGNAMDIFELVLDGKSISEIASQLSLTENSVYVIRSRVKARFQTEIRRIRSLLEFPA